MDQRMRSPGAAPGCDGNPLSRQAQPGRRPIRGFQMELRVLPECLPASWGQLAACRSTASNEKDPLPAQRDRERGWREATRRCAGRKEALVLVR
jgi:hypothetical protein